MKISICPNTASQCGSRLWSPPSTVMRVMSAPAAWKSSIVCCLPGRVDRVVGGAVRDEQRRLGAVGERRRREVVPVLRVVLVGAVHLDDGRRTRASRAARSDRRSTTGRVLTGDIATTTSKTSGATTAAAIDSPPPSEWPKTPMLPGFETRDAGGGECAARVHDVRDRAHVDVGPAARVRIGAGESRAGRVENTTCPLRANASCSRTRSLPVV